MRGFQVDFQDIRYLPNGVLVQRTLTDLVQTDRRLGDVDGLHQLLLYHSCELALLLGQIT